MAFGCVFRSSVYRDDNKVPREEIKITGKDWANIILVHLAVAAFIVLAIAIVAFIVD